MSYNRLFIFFFFAVLQVQGFDFANESVLSKGEWYKISIENEGVYKIDYTLLKSMGIDVDKINPAHIHLHGFGGVLPQPLATFRYDDLPEMAIEIIGAEDGVFNTSDYIIFYAQDVNTWNDGLYIKNTYAKKAFYYLTINESTAKRVTKKSINSSDITFNYCDVKFHYENDLVNVKSLGRVWYEPMLDVKNGQSFNFSLNGVLDNTDVIYKITTLCREGSTKGEFETNVNNTNKHLHPTFQISDRIESDYGQVLTIYDTIQSNKLTNSEIKFLFKYNTGLKSVAFLNYIELFYKKNITLNNNYLTFSTKNAQNYGNVNYVIKNSTNETRVWDVTEFVNATAYNGNISESTYSVNVTGGIKNLIAFNPSLSPKPTFVGKQSNQNIHGLNSANLVIVTHPNFKSEAERLANFKRTHDKLSVHVLTVDEIYPEFSSGRQDVSAIRNCLKMFYEKGKGTSNQLGYLMLFGACSYDYLDRIPNNTNYVPTYQSDFNYSLNQLDGYSSDDYFALLGDTKGLWSEKESFKPEINEMDIAVGRIPVASVSDATLIVDKIINYSSNAKSLGEWRNKITVVADNEEYNSHLNDGEAIVSKLKSSTNQLNFRKIYVSAFPLESTPTGRISVLGRNALVNSLTQGSLILHYSGHGSEFAWASERVLSFEMIDALKNKDRLTFFVAATCEFGRLDDPSITSGAYKFMFNSNGGAIGGLIAGRPVYQSNNNTLSAAFYQDLYTKQNGKWPRIGDVIKNAKNSTATATSHTNRTYVLMGDPSMILAYPKDSVVVTKLNNKSFTSLDTINALSEIQIEGEIRKEGSINNSFNGKMKITFYDKISEQSTIATESTPVAKYGLENSIIYSGNVSVKNGLFTAKWIVPKDIAYQYDMGRISMYAISDKNEDASGYVSILVGGVSKDFKTDISSPTISLYMNDETFKNGGRVSSNAILGVKLYDESGINTTTSGIGHQLVAWLDNDLSNPYILNEFYESEQDNYKSGRIMFPFNDLTPGPHHIEVRVWDTHNNSSKSRIDFVVTENGKIYIEKTFTVPNPISESASFGIEHSRGGEDLLISCVVYNSQGETVDVLNFDVADAPSFITDLNWYSNNLQTLPSGVYYYLIKIRSKVDNSEESKYSKFVVIK